MSNNKKSFLLHIDSLDILDELTDEEAGMLFKAIRDHQSGVDLKLEGLVRIAFSPFRNQFKRDDEKYNLTCKRRAEAGSKGGKQKVANASKSKQKVAKVAESDSKNKNKSDSKSDNYITPLVQPKVKPKKVNYSDYHIAFAKWMHSLILNINPNAKEPSFESWANTIRLMTDIDKRNGDEMVKVFQWANQDSFWNSNILSADKFRKQYDQLYVKSKQEDIAIKAANNERTQVEVDQFTAELNDQFRRSQEAKQRREARAMK